MKCRRCRSHAIIEIRRHNAGFCRPCFLEHCLRQVSRAIEEHSMCTVSERILVGVSGGKDSLALWDILLSLGFDAAGVYIDLGIGEYSERSHKSALAYANSRGRSLAVINLIDEAGFDVVGGSSRSRRPSCSICGLSKRHWLNRMALSGGYDAIATGHNLDDEAATLLGNLLHWQTEYVARQGAVLPSTAQGFVRKIKPLIRLGERETAAYCFLRGIDYMVEECPMSTGNTGLRYKAALDVIEETSPGTRQMFLGKFYARGRHLFTDSIDLKKLVICQVCGAPTSESENPVCAYCRMAEQAVRDGHKDEQG